VILLDTNAVVWMDRHHPRARRLAGATQRLYLSPATLLELQLLIEVGRLRLRDGTIGDLTSDPRWLLDDPPAAAWFERAIELTWTRDPFDRLLVAHARLRGWRLASGDTVLLAQLSERERLPL
jgi:PIN domain nuclease of toxin-antitoxin system